MKVLVTGGAGFIGSHVAIYFVKKGNSVVVFDNLSRAKLLGKATGNPHYNWNYLKNNYPNIELLKGDVRNMGQLKAASKNVDVIIHTAAQTAVTTSLSDPRTDFETNAIGTFNVVEMARLNDASLVYCSTNKVYGDNVNNIPVGEQGKRYRFSDKKYFNGIPETFSIDLCGHSPYGCSKLAADLYVQDYSYTYSLKTGIFRMSCIYGERQFGVEDQGWVAWFIIATLTHKPITIYGDGKQVRDILHVTDLIQAYNSFIESKLKHDVFNIGGGPEKSISLLELIDLLKEVTSISPTISFADWRASDQKVYISNVSKAKTLLNWTPKISPREGITRLQQWVSSNMDVLR
jgi:CDP-paratose 2-epimerase